MEGVIWRVVLALEWLAAYWPLALAGAAACTGAMIWICLAIDERRFGK